METCQALGGYFTNDTQASGQPSLQDDVKDSSKLEEPVSQTSRYLQDGKDDQVQYETDEEEFEDATEPGTVGPCHLYGGTSSSNKYPGMWPVRPSQPSGGNNHS